MSRKIENKPESIFKEIFGLRPLKSWRLWGLILISTYTILGFILVPYIIKTQLVEQTPDLLNREIAISEVQFNPFSLSLTVKGLSLSDLDKVELVGLDQLHINFETSSLFRWAWTFSEISFTEPRFNYRINKSGDPSFKDIIDSGTPEIQQINDGPAEDTAMPRVVIQLFQVTRGQVNFEDLSNTTPFNQTINPLNFKLVEFSTLPDKEGPYKIHVEIPGGGQIRWQGEVAINPLSSEGNLEISSLPLNTAWKYLQDQLRFSLDSGFLAGSLHYHFHMENTGPDLSMNAIQLALSEIQIRDKNHETNDIELPMISLTGGRFDLHEQKVHIDEITLESGNVNTFLSEGGKLHLEQLLTPLEKEIQETAQVKTQVPTKKAENESPWLFEIDRASVNTFNVQFIDRTTQPDTEVRLDDISILMTDITNQADDKFGLQASLKLNKKGALKLTGTVAALEPMADLSLELKSIPLSDFQSYLNKDTNIELISGNASLTGKLHYKTSEKDADIKLSGKFDINSFSANNHLTGENIASWKNLTIEDLDLKLFPDQLDISSVTLDRLHGNIKIASDGSINVDRLLKTDTTSSPPETEVEKTVEPFPIALDVVKLKNSAISFTDNTVKPRFTSQLNGVQGTIKGLSSENIARADVNISGRVDDYATLLVTGKINPLSDNLYTDLKLRFSDYDMASLTPYTGHYIGNAVDKGRMSFDLNYRVSKNDLKGGNKILLDQFTLGEKIDSKEALNLPIGLAVALLKDGKGMIDIDVPVEGDLNDPKFRISGLVFSALGNVITNIATSPFKLLSKLAGGDGDMDSVVFLPGKLIILPEHDKRLTTLSKALLKRPQLLLEVRGQYDVIRDKSVLQTHKLRNQMQLTHKQVTKETHLEDIDISILEKYYIDLTSLDAINILKTPNTIVKENSNETEKSVSSVKKSSKVLDQSKYKAALLRSLLLTQKVSDDELRELARSRANAVRNLLVNTGGLNANRIFVLEATPDKSATKEGVVTQFTLTAK